LTVYTRRPRTRTKNITKAKSKNPNAQAVLRQEAHSLPRPHKGRPGSHLGRCFRRRPQLVSRLLLPPVDGCRGLIPLASNFSTFVCRIRTVGKRDTRVYTGSRAPMSSMRKCYICPMGLGRERDLIPSLPGVVSACNALGFRGCVQVCGVTSQKFE
jgi:hypothetical protein